MDKKNKITMSAYRMVIAAILVGSFFAVSIVQQAIAQGNTTSHNATGAAAAGNATAAGNKTGGGGSQGAK
jgi:hypothetical protein